MAAFLSRSQHDMKVQRKCRKSIYGTGHDNAIYPHHVHNVAVLA